MSLMKLTIPKMRKIISDLLVWGGMIMVVVSLVWPVWATAIFIACCVIGVSMRKDIYCCPYCRTSLFGGSLLNAILCKYSRCPKCGAKVEAEIK